ncbi:MAG: MFS transporter [Betaproteobacteria bacterium]|nr:MFS transporter [Betaproteobacteria bacterium]
MNRVGALPLRRLAAYGALRAPLALVELPVFVMVPAFYGAGLGLDIALVGAVLFGMRLLDALIDPLIGARIDGDRVRGRRDERRWIQLALPVLALGFGAMFLPPVQGAAAAVWLALTSGITYVAYSAVSIAYQAWGAGLADTASQRARVTAVREGFGLAGVLAASGLMAPAMAPWLIAAFLSLAALAAWLMRAAPAPRPAPSLAPGDRRVWQGWREVLGNQGFRWLLAAFMINGVATAIPATLVLFFTQDVLGASETETSVLLGTYFLAGALGMPLWIAASRRLGLRNAWLVGMSFSVLAFLWALSLGRGDLIAFGLVCAMTGLALGSDLVMPSALLAALIDGAGHGGRREGAYFGLWNLATKLNLAIAAGLALPLLSLLGYLPGQPGGGLALSMTYAALPCALKLLAGVIVLIAPLPDAALRDATPEATALP